MIVFKKIVIF